MNASNNSEPFVSVVTPVYNGEKRSLDIGVLHDRDRRLADFILEAAGKRLDYRILRNEPYDANDGVTHTLREHALKNTLPNVMIEIRNDLITGRGGATKLARDLAGLFRLALDSPDFGHAERQL